jgi:hypothetical protein
MKSYKLFCSFIDLYNLLDSGKVSFDDLRQETSLFLFSHSRSDVLGPLPDLTSLEQLFPTKTYFACYQWLTKTKLIPVNTWFRLKNHYVFYFREKRVPIKNNRKLKRNYSWCLEFQNILRQAENQKRVQFDNPLIGDEAARELLSSFGLWIPEYEELDWESNFHWLTKVLAGKVQVLWR